MRTRITTAILLHTLVATASACPNPPAQDGRSSAASVRIHNVWPQQPPDESGSIAPEVSTPDQGAPPTTRITNVSLPTISHFPAPAHKANGTAVLVCPGGGLQILAWDKEGTEVARWLNSIGVTAFVLKYRVPPRQKDKRWRHPLQDCQRAMSLIRSQASEFGINSKRIGILGFSAGGFLAAMTSVSFDDRQYERIDAVDDASSRPDFGVLVYPAYLVGKDAALHPHVRVTRSTPPMFFAHAGNDRIRAENSIALFSALRREGIAGELHVYDSGGHGFGLRKTPAPASRWPELCRRWMERNGWLNGWSEQQISKLPADETPVRLFNGRSLDGWRPQSKKHFHVQNGMIVARNHIADAPRASTYLLTENKYRNFRLIFEARLVTSEMHSGIALWGEPVTRDQDPNSYRGHLVMFPSNYGFWDLYRRNGIYQDKNRAARKAGVQHGWNRMEILAIGNRIRHVINGRLVADWRDPKPELCGTGPLGLQLHSNRVPQEIHFRGLVLTEDPEDRVVTATP